MVRRPTTPASEKPNLPERDPVKHRAHLLCQLDALLLSAQNRALRDPAATREIVAIRPPSAEMQLSPAQLADRSGDVRIVGVIPETGVVLLDAPDAQLPKLREKAAEFGEPKTRTKSDGTSTTAPAHQHALAPVEEIALAAPGDWEGVRLSAALAANQPDPQRPAWFEIACRGGYRNALEDTSNSRAQVQRQLFHLGHPAAQDFVAPEEVTFFVRLSLAAFSARTRTLIPA